MSIFLTILAASVLTAPKGEIYNDSLVVTNVSFEGLANMTAVRGEIARATNSIPQTVTNVVRDVSGSLFNHYISATNDDFVAAVNASRVSADDSIVAEIAEYAGVDVPTAGATSIGALLIVILGGLAALKRKKQDKLTAGENVTIAKDGTISAELPYRLVELPIGETQLQNRTANHITEKNIVGEWRDSSYGHTQEVSIERYNPDTQSFGEGDYYYTVRIPEFPNHVFVSAEKVSDIFLGTSWQTFSPVALADNAVFSKVVITPTELTTNLLGWSVSSPVTDGVSNHYLKFKFISQSDGSEYEAELRDYVDDYWGSRYQWTMDFQPAGYCYHTGSIIFSGDNVPSELEEQSEWYFEFDAYQYGNLKFNPGDTVSLTTYNVSGYDIELIFPNEELVWTRLEEYHRQSGKLTVSFYGYNESGEEEEVGKCEDVEIDVDYRSGYLDIYRFECYYQDMHEGYEVSMRVSDSGYGAISESDALFSVLKDPFEVGKPVVLDGKALESSSAIVAGANMYLDFEGEFSFRPPQQDGDGARDFLLCFDIPEPAPAAIEGVIEADPETLTIPSGRTLVSVTEPVAGVLYASSRILPTEEDA